VTGIDANLDMVKDLQERGYPNVVVADAEDFNLGQTFNTIVGGELIEHLANPGRFLQCCRRHLASGGRIVLTTPYPFSLFYTLYGFAKYPKTCSNDEHTSWFCPHTLRALAGQVGLRLLHFELVEDYLSEVVSSRKYILFVRLVRLLRFLPRRLRANCHLFVLEPVEDVEAPS
jgi:SAM-dependent methyltransferase